MITDELREARAEREDNSPVREAVMTLPEKYRVAIYLYYFEGYSAKEIAKMTGKSENAVALQLSRGRRQLRTILKNYGRERVRYYGKNMEG